MIQKYLHPHKLAYANVKDLYRYSGQLRTGEITGELPSITLYNLYKYDWNLDIEEYHHIENLNIITSLKNKPPELKYCDLSFNHHNLNAWISPKFDELYLKLLPKINLTLRVSGYVVDAWELIDASVKRYGENILLNFRKFNKINLNIKYSVEKKRNYIQLRLPVNEISTKNFDIPICSDEALKYFRQDYRYALIYLSKKYAYEKNN